MVAIIDYDAGNIKSVEKACIALGQNVVITRDRDTIRRADHVILPGVGSFGDAMQHLQEYHLVEVIKEVCDSGTPFLGICLGLQLLFQGSDESPDVPGLGILDGFIHAIPAADGLKIPHVGWNSLDLINQGRLFQDLSDPAFVYFVHSFYLKAQDPSIVTATAEYGVTIHASVEKGNVFACQFHPEKSSLTGLKILENFLKAERNV